MHRPILTILLPVYNGEASVSQAIESILNQTFQDYELLIIDDGSTDSSIDIAASFNDERIKIIKHNHQGLVAALQWGITQCDTKYVARMDADDISLPDRLTNQINFLETHPEYGLTACSFFVQAKNKIIKKTIVPEDDPEIKLAMRYFNPFTHGAVMLRMSVLNDHQLNYQQKDKYYEDYALWVRMIPYTKFYIIPEPLYIWTISPGSVTDDHLSEMKFKVAQLAASIPFDPAVLQNVSKPYPEYYQKLLYYVGKDLLHQTKILKGISYIEKSFRINPSAYFRSLLPYKLRRNSDHLPLQYLYDL